MKSYWLDEAKKFGDKDAKIVLFMNKNDLEGNEAHINKFKDLANGENLDFYFVSAKTGDNLTKAFIQICREFMSQRV